MQKTYMQRFIMLIVVLIHWCIMTAVWAWIWYQNYADIIELPFYRKGNWLVVGIYGVLLMMVTQFYGGYRVGYYKRGDIIFSGILSMLVTNVITYLQAGLIARRLMNVLPIVWMSLADLVLIWIWATLANKLYLSLNPPRHLLVVYGGSRQAQSLITKIADRDDKYLIREAINIDEGFSKVLERIDEYRSILICDVKSAARNRLLKYCYERDIRVYMTPKISDVLIRGSSEIHLFDSPLLLSRNNGLRLEQRMIKRALDIVCSCLGLLLAWPFMLLIAAAIKLCDGGPVLYRQTRLTRGAREFSLYKFRSMVVGAESDTGAVLAGKDDNRVTPVGRAIRRIRLDELPQLLNILKGDMSLVGPRPERPEIAAEYRKTMEEFDFRLKVKAGLTGYAQVMGQYNTTPYDKLKLDLMYISNYSLLMDLKLVLMTVKILFLSRSSEGVRGDEKKQRGT